jgi:hypothetical protein
MLIVNKKKLKVKFFFFSGPIVAYHYLSCEFEPHSWRGVLEKTLCDIVCQWLATGLWDTMLGISEQYLFFYFKHILLFKKTKG